MHTALIPTLLLASAALQSGTLTFTKPSTWTDRPAASSMRVAEFVVPKAAGDVEDGELIVYYFGGGGGNVQANIDRWIGQFKPEPGATTSQKMESLTVNGLKVTTIAVRGTYIAEVRPGSTERHNKPNFSMRAAVVETPKGPYFIKLIGPAATVQHAGSSFDQFLKSVRFQ
jgi:hypothetical protein